MAKQLNRWGEFPVVHLDFDFFGVPYYDFDIEYVLCRICDVGLNYGFEAAVALWNRRAGPIFGNLWCIRFYRLYYLRLKHWSNFVPYTYTMS